MCELAEWLNLRTMTQQALPNERQKTGIGDWKLEYIVDASMNQIYGGYQNPMNLPD